MTYMFVYRLSVEASDHLMEKQMAAYSVLVDTAEEKGGTGTCCSIYCVYLWKYFALMNAGLFHYTKVMLAGPD